MEANRQLICFGSTPRTARPQGWVEAKLTGWPAIASALIVRKN
jgi:hypothetical protein